MSSFSFELFGLRAQVYSQLMQFMLARKGYDNHHCHNKPPDRKWGRNVEDVRPGRDGPENLRILKKSQLRLDHGGRELSFCHWGIELSFLPLRRRLSFSGLGRRKWIEILNITRCAARWWGQHSKNCISLLVPPLTEVKKFVNRSYLKQQSPPVFCVCIYIVLLLRLISSRYTTIAFCHR